MKKVLKFYFEQKEGYLSVVEKGDKYYALVEKETPKVKAIQDTNHLAVSYELKSPNYIDVFVRVIEDENLTKWVFDALAAQKNLYFKELNDALCVLEIDQESR